MSSLSLTTTPDLLPAVLSSYLPWPAIEPANGDDDSDCYDTLVGELDRTLNDPRAAEYRVSALDDYVRSEVQRSIRRIRMLRRIRRPLDGPVPTAADLRTLGRLLAEVAFTAVQASAARELEALDRESPELEYTIKYHCAEEACYLIGRFSTRPRDHLSHVECGAFRLTTKKLYEAVTGEIDADVSRACDRVLRNWRRFAPRE